MSDMHTRFHVAFSSHNEKHERHVLGPRYHTNAFAAPAEGAHSAPQTSRLDMKRTNGKEGQKRKKKRKRAREEE